jgi:hypothetical protein
MCERLRIFGGVPLMLVPDGLKAAVTVSCRYEPAIQRTYAEFAGHYGTAVVPARPYKARDKAKVEVGVQIAQRWILARLRKETFFSLEALNARVRVLLGELNERPMKKLGGISRRELFERVEPGALQPLPEHAYECAEWIERTVNLDYHVDVDKHWYSVPYELVHETVWARFAAKTVEICTTTGGSLRMCEAEIRTSTRRSVRTCRRRIAGTQPALTAYSHGRRRWGRWRLR